MPRHDQKRWGITGVWGAQRNAQDAQEKLRHMHCLSCMFIAVNELEDTKPSSQVLLDFGTPKSSVHLQHSKINAWTSSQLSTQTPQFWPKMSHRRVNFQIWSAINRFNQQLRYYTFRWGIMFSLSEKKRVDVPTQWSQPFICVSRANARMAKNACVRYACAHWQEIQPCTVRCI